MVYVDRIMKYSPEKIEVKTPKASEEKPEEQAKSNTKTKKSE